MINVIKIRSITGKMIASTSEDDVRVWSVYNGRQWTHEYLSNGKRFQSVIFHPRYHNVVVIGGYQVYSSLRFHYDHCVPYISPFKQLLQRLHLDSVIVETVKIIKILIERLHCAVLSIAVLGIVDS
jgi:transglutaminase/protease-like cytokinesis protein 3